MSLMQALAESPVGMVVQDIGPSGDLEAHVVGSVVVVHLVCQRWQPESLDLSLTGNGALHEATFDAVLRQVCPHYGRDRWRSLKR